MKQENATLRITLCALCLLLAAPGGAARQHEHSTDRVKKQLGAVEFRVSCNTEAQASFIRAVALLHSFAYEESAQAFRDASTKDPQCAMAHWGLAMTEYHQLWEPPPGQPQLQRGATEIRKARELKPGTPLERDYIEALGVFFEDWDHRNHAARALSLIHI